MANYFGGGHAVCPYYKGEGQWYVQCESPARGAALSLQFPGKTAMIRHLSQICGSFYYKERCPMARENERKYQSDMRSLCMERIALARRSANPINRRKTNEP